MGVTKQLWKHPQTLWRRASYVARTEGAAAMLLQTARFVGLAPDRRIDWDALPRDPSPLTASSRTWPASLLVVSGGSPRAAQLADVGFPVLYRQPEDHSLAAAQELVSIVFVVGLANLRHEIIHQARRLDQRLVVEVEPQDDVGPGGLPACDALLVAADRPLSAGAVPVVLPHQGQGLAEFLLGETR